MFLLFITHNWFLFRKFSSTLGAQDWLRYLLWYSLYLPYKTYDYFVNRSNRKAMNRNWSNQKANPALKTKTGNKYILQIDKIQ